MDTAIFIPGWAASPQLWQSVMNGLAEVVDPHAIPWPDAVFGEPPLLHQVVAGSPAPVVLAGWSLGSLAIMQTALAFPDRVKALVLVSGTPRLTADPKSDYPGSDPRACRAMRAKLQSAPEEVLRDFATLGFHPSPASRFCEAFVMSGMLQNREELQRGLDYLNTTDLRDRVGELRMPVLLIHGTEDQVVPVGSCRWLAARLPQATLVELPGAGHTLPTTQALAVVSAIRDFLGRLGQPAPLP